MPRKIVHKASKVNEGGDVSALCYKRPHAIDLSRASWTVVDTQVTCPRCRKAMKG